MKMDLQNDEKASVSEFGKFLANPPPGDEVVITGMAGRFPKSDNIYQLRDNLTAKLYMVDNESPRWKANHPALPELVGFFSSVEKFDSEFFGFNKSESDMMDPTCRMFLEHALEAILDAGVRPDELRGTKTGVYVSSHFSDAETELLFDTSKTPNLGITLCTRSMFAQQISFLLGLEGPSCWIDTACNSGISALAFAYQAIRTGKLDNALIGASNLALNPLSVMGSFRMGALSTDGVCKSFDEKADGYARSESASFIFVQRLKQAKRVYAKVVHVKLNSDGFKEQGITYPNGISQKQLAEEVYEECGINPATIDFVEAHCTGTKVGDPEELKGLQQVFCLNRKSPLYVGSIKSNIGHTEMAAGLSSLIKVLLSMENNCLFPNINLLHPRKDIEAIRTGKMVVVTENIPWPKNSNKFAGINSFGIGGTNAHLVLKPFWKNKVSGSEPNDDLPRLVCVSGRTKESVSCILNDISGRSLDVEFVRLLHEIFRKNTPRHKYRGYIIRSKTGVIEKSIKKYKEMKPSLCLFFGDLNGQLMDLNELRAIPAFQDIIQKINILLSSKGIVINELLTKKERPLATLVGVAVQIAIVDTLKALEVDVDYSFGNLAGELVAAYADGTLTLRQCVMAAYHTDSFARDLNTNTINVEVQKDQLNSDEGRYSCLLQQKLKEIIPEPKGRVAKWLSSFEGVHVKSFTSNMINVDASSKLALLTIGQELTHLHNDKSMEVLSVTTAKSFFVVLGRLYELGFNPKLERLYPNVEWPVSANTPMISPLIKWDHSESHYVWRYNNSFETDIANNKITCSLDDPNWSFIAGHVVDGTILFPATGYIYLVWRSLANIEGEDILNRKISFENVKFLRAVGVPKKGNVRFIVIVNHHTGNFKVLVDEQQVASGRVNLCRDLTYEEQEFPITNEAEYPLTLSTKEIYKKLNLRGYGYTGAFRGLKEYDLNSSKGLVEWKDNWVAFLDSVCQTTLLESDSGLFVPVEICQLIINPAVHLQNLIKSDEGLVASVYNNVLTGTIKSPGIEIIKIIGKPIARRKNVHTPLLETYQFIPYEAQLELEQCIEVIIQILLENANFVGSVVRVVEVADENPNYEPLALLIYTYLNNQPLTKGEVVILSKCPLKHDNITVQNTSLAQEKDHCNVVVTSRIFSKPELIPEITAALKATGFILSRESLTFNPSEQDLKELKVLAVHETGKEKLVLLRRVDEVACWNVINYNNSYKDLSWLSKLQRELDLNKGVIVVAQNDATNGILGFMNCLRREPGNFNMKCFFLFDKTPQFNINCEFYAKQLSKGLAINVYKDKKWGSYRYLPLKHSEDVPCEHVFSTITNSGDLSSMRWVQGPLTTETILPPERIKINVYYASLNFKDVLLATGRVTSQVVLQNTWNYSSFGFEVAGKTNSGQRVVALINGGGIATLIEVSESATFEIPDDWSLEDAAASFQTYTAAIYSLIETAQIKPGQSILIHAGSGATGQAAINIALHFKCEVFTTVSEAKRDFILKQYPQIPENHIGNSRDTSFEEIIFRETNGRGVDIILNSLSEDKLRASLRCLASGGVFLELGKVDFENNNLLDLVHLTKNCSFHGIAIDEKYRSDIKSLRNMIRSGINAGYVKPLPKMIFKDDEVEQALRFVAAGKHIGKVLIQIRQDEPGKLVPPSRRVLKGMPRFYCYWDKSYVIIGGLGGFGLELAEWLISRGARKLILVSRKGLTTKYQALKLRAWESMGAKVKISTTDVTTEEGCTELINEARALGDIDAIFNLSLVLRDAVLQDQNEEDFVSVLRAKANATEYLDNLSRRMCPKLRKFVVFSSAVCGRGNAGQTNYGMANSVMERICEQRKGDGYSALAIQWGAIGDVGMVAETFGLDTQVDICGVLQQKMSSCLESIDLFLTQDEAIVSSVVVAKGDTTDGKPDSIIEIVQKALGLKDLKNVSQHVSLSELGMDSITAVVIRQALEKDYNLLISAQEMRKMTFARLQEISENNSKEGATPETVETDPMEEFIFLVESTVNDEEDESDVIVAKLPSGIKENASAPKLFIVPGLDGTTKNFEKFAENLEYHVFCLRHRTFEPSLNVEEVIELLLPHVKDNLSKSDRFILLGYSYGVVLTMELIRCLEDEGYLGKIILLDTTLETPKMFFKDIMPLLPPEQLQFVMEAMSTYGQTEVTLPWNTVVTLVNEIKRSGVVPKDMGMAIDKIIVSNKFTENRKSSVLVSYCIKLLTSLIYTPEFKINSQVNLFLCSDSITKNQQDLGLDELSKNPVQIYNFIGNHFTILKSIEVQRAINDMIQTL